ncbi:hypothetical protein T484DRAFT_1876678 [Baffinella frigidus]|nr:hypothetical protein T484DRAFT_1876678 [Cryptophyta sp. CCMP2293]
MPGTAVAAVSNIRESLLDTAPNILTSAEGLRRRSCTGRRRSSTDDAGCRIRRASGLAAALVPDGTHASRISPRLQPGSDIDNDVSATHLSTEDDTSRRPLQPLPNLTSPQLQPLPNLTSPQPQPLPNLTTPQPQPLPNLTTSQPQRLPNLAEGTEVRLPTLSSVSAWKLLSVRFKEANKQCPRASSTTTKETVVCKSATSGYQVRKWTPRPFGEDRTPGGAQMHRCSTLTEKTRETLLPFAAAPAPRRAHSMGPHAGAAHSTGFTPQDRLNALVAASARAAVRSSPAEDLPPFANYLNTRRPSRQQPRESAQADAICPPEEQHGARAHEGRRSIPRRLLLKAETSPGPIERPAYEESASLPASEGDAPAAGADQPASGRTGYLAYKKTSPP